VPLVRIDLHEGRSEEDLAAIGDGIAQYALADQAAAGS
jgi:hypothetical protein